MTEKKQLLSEAQIRRMAAIAGIPALGTLVAEKVKIDTTNEEATTEETVEEATGVVEGDKYYEEDEDPNDEASMEAGDDVPQEKIESLVDAVLAAIEAETGVPAQRVDDEAPAEDAPEMDAEEPEMEMGEEEPEEEMMETSTPSLAERIAQAVQAVIDEDASLEEGSCGSYNEEDEEKMKEGAHKDDEEKMKEGAHEDDEEKMKEGYGKKMEEDEEEMEEANATDDDTLEEITKAVVARLRSLK